MPRWCRYRKEGGMAGHANTLGHLLRGVSHIGILKLLATKLVLAWQDPVARQPVLRLGGQRGAMMCFPDESAALPEDKSPLALVQLSSQIFPRFTSFPRFLFWPPCLQQRTEGHQQDLSPLPGTSQMFLRPQSQSCLLISFSR